MKSQSLVPLLQWSEEVFRIGRGQGLSTKEIIESIKVISKDRGWHDSQINKILRHNGVLKSPRPPNPVFIICPKCGFYGRLTSFHHHTTGRPGNVEHAIFHDKLEGTWCKRPMRRRRRCYFRNIFNRQSETYLKKIAEQLFPYDP